MASTLAACGGGSTNSTGAAGTTGVAGAPAGTGGSAGGRAGTGGSVGSAGTGGVAGSVGGTGTGGSGPGGTGGAGPSCAAGRVLCGSECVDTTADPRHCGGCGQACGASQVCASSGCQVAGDCRQTPCAGFSYCDLANGQCKPGCALDAQCTADETCDIATHACVCKTGFNRCGGTCVANSSGLLGCGTVCAVCPTTNATAFACSGTSCVATTCASGYHVCSGSCVANNSVASCGTSCTPCPVPANGTATCNGTSCGMTCNAGTMSCGGVCATCPTTGVMTVACSGTSCVATACAASGYRLCGGACAACPTANVSTTTCSGTSCVISTCLSGYHVCTGACVSNSSIATCGNSCTPCPTVANGTTTCNGTSCSATCATGYRLCGGVCALCPTPAASTTCGGVNAQQCLVSTCASGRHVCSGICVLNSSLDTCGTTSCTPCPAPAANGVATCNGTACGVTCNTGWIRCGASGCCADCRQMSGVCTGLDWCSDINGLCAPVQKLQPDAANAASRLFFGYRVALSGSLAVVGAERQDGDAGAVYTFERQADGKWLMQGSKLQPTTVYSSYFGTPVSLSGQRLLVGASGSSVVLRGSAYVFERTGGQWVQQAKLNAEADGDRFGFAASIDGDRALVGADEATSGGFSGAGAAYIFERQSDGTWPTTGIRLQASNPAANARFGIAGSISGDRALVGNGTTATYVFARQANGAWTEEQILTTAGPSTNQFRRDLSIVGDRAVIGAAADADRGPSAGAVHVFERQANGVWTQTAKLYQPTAAGGTFGGAVSQHGDRIAVGARAAQTVNSAGTLVSAGLSYVYRRNSDGTWSAGAVIGSHPDDVIDARGLGCDVSISGDFILMGAYGDFAGPPSSAYQTGTAYVADIRSVLP